MRLVLARWCGESGGSSVVHAYRVPARSGAGAETEGGAVVEREPESWVSACGERAAPGGLEIVEPCTGVPCSACAVAVAVASGVEPVTREELEAPPDELTGCEGSKSVTAASGELFALSWRELVIHRITADAPSLPHDGRVLVLGLCNQLGWGPLRSPSVPGSEFWTRCEECELLYAETAGARA